MEDLDALLADLQSTTSHISNQATQPVTVRSPSYNQVVTNYTIGSRDSVDSLEDQPPPLPPPPSQDVLDSLSGHPTQPVPGEGPNTAVHSAGSPLVQQGTVAVDDKPGRAAMSTLSSNLSELDSLLADLNSAQFMAEVDKRNSANRQLPSPPVKVKPATLPKPTKDTSGGQPVDALLDDLQNAVPSTGRTNAPHQSSSVQSNFHSFGVQPAPAASTATQELDDLMASLSQFKVTGNPQPRGAGDYNSVAPANSPPVQQSMTPQAQPARGDQLDAMLGNLQTDMSRHGVTTIPKGHCAACNKPIVGQVITALGHTWHPEHFACFHCGEELGTRNFFERDGQPYCEKDYHGLFSPRCAYCNGPILDKCITALDHTWHPEHFFCAQCGRPFQDDGFHEKDGKAYCREDYFEMFAPKCGGCSRPIMDNYISALNRQWHPECFVCADCHVSFGGGSFFDHEGLPFCETHYHAKRGSLCAGCQKPITGRCITAMYKKFHPEHFVCAFCLKQLNKGTFKEQNDKPYCHPCFVKLFG